MAEAAQARQPSKPAGRAQEDGGGSTSETTLKPYPKPHRCPCTTTTAKVPVGCPCAVHGAATAEMRATRGQEGKEKRGKKEKARDGF